MRLNDRRAEQEGEREAKEEKEEREAEEGLVGCGRGVQEVQLNAERKCRRKRGNFWVKTCFLGKGLSPSKLSTKALCGDTRKRGNEKPDGN